MRSPVTRKRKVVPSKRRKQVLAGVKNLGKLVSYKKYTLKTNNAPKRTTRPAPSRSVVSKTAPNPWAPKYTWAPWGNSGVVHDNCYDYAFGSFSNNRTSKSVPGDRSGNKSNGLTFRTCDGIAKRVL